MTPKFAFRIDELAKAGPLGRSRLYEEIRAGRLIARKAGKSTFILADDWQRYLAELPQIERRAA